MTMINCFIKNWFILQPTVVQATNVITIHVTQSLINAIQSQDLPPSKSWCISDSGAALGQKLWRGDSLENMKLFGQERTGGHCSKTKYTSCHLRSTYPGAPSVSGVLSGLEFEKRQLKKQANTTVLHLSCSGAVFRKVRLFEPITNKAKRLQPKARLKGFRIIF